MDRIAKLSDPKTERTSLEMKEGLQSPRAESQTIKFNTKTRSCPSLEVYIHQE